MLTLSVLLTQFIIYYSLFGINDQLRLSHILKHVSVTYYAVNQNTALCMSGSVCPHALFHCICALSGSSDLCYNGLFFNDWTK